MPDLYYSSPHVGVNGVSVSAAQLYVCGQPCPQTYLYAEVCSSSGLLGLSISQKAAFQRLLPETCNLIAGLLLSRSSASNSDRTSSWRVDQTTGPKSSREIPNSRKTARTVPRARSRGPQSGMVVTCPVAGLYHLWRNSAACDGNRPVCSGVLRIPGRAVSLLVGDISYWSDQNVKGLGLVGADRGEDSWWFLPWFCLGLQQGRQGLFYIGQDLGRSASLGHQAGHVRAGNCVDPIMIWFQVQTDTVHDHHFV